MTLLDKHIAQVIQLAETLVAIKECDDTQKVEKLIEKYNFLMDDIVAYQFETDGFVVDAKGNLIAIL
jgi:hypothetical protein